MERVAVQAGFIGGTAGGFCVQFLPATPPRAHIIYLPPFTEEMNRCRCSVAEQARWFTEHGYSCSLLDFYGTGESPGNMADASLSIWLQNIEALQTSITQQHDVPVYLWGCRLGALLATHYIATRPTGIEQVIFWQPVTSGKTFVTQILRQRIASLMEKGGEAETTSEIRERLNAGENIEVAGYILGGRLMSEIDSLEINSSSPPSPIRVFWLEHTLDPSMPIGPKSQKAIDRLKESGAEVISSVFSGPPVWQLHERDTCEDLLKKTRALQL